MTSTRRLVIYGANFKLPEEPEGSDEDDVESINLDLDPEEEGEKDDDGHNGMDTEGNDAKQGTRDDQDMHEGAEEVKNRVAVPKKIKNFANVVVALPRYASAMYF